MDAAGAAPDSPPATSAGAVASEDEEAPLGPTVGGSVNEGIERPAVSLPEAPSMPTLPPPPDPVTVIASGNLGSCSQHTLEVLEAMVTDAGTILAAGDLSHDGTAASLAECFRAPLGDNLDRLIAVPGDRDLTGDGAAFYELAAQSVTETQPDEGWFVTTIGAWQIIGLNSECDRVGGCDVESAQYQWLDATLREQPAECRLAFFHDARFTSEHRKPNANDMGALVGRLQGAGTDVIITGSPNGYERVGPVRPSGKPPEADETGMMHFNIGGRGYAWVGVDIEPASAAIVSQASGYVRFVLSPDGYTWEFVDVSADGDATDSGSLTC